MASWRFFAVCNSESSSILSHIMLNAVKYNDGDDRPSGTCFGIGFRNSDWHDIWCLPSTATRSLLPKLKVYDLKHLRYLESTLS